MQVARYRLEFTITKQLSLPAYAGSAIRGVFGAALRNIACITKEPTCNNCPLIRTCPYAVVFESAPPEAEHSLQKFSQIPHPYIIEPPEWGNKTLSPDETISFNLVLIGKALEHLPLILWAFVCAFRAGIGRGDGTAELLKVTHIGVNETIVLEGANDTLIEHDNSIPSSPKISEELKLKFITPLRIQKNSHPLGAKEINARDLLVALIRRVALLSEFHCNYKMEIDFSEMSSRTELITSEKNLQWRDWVRYSNRQQQKMTLGGLVGEWVIKGDLQPFAEFLYLGQWLHVGKEATFGMGGYRILL